MRGGEIADPHRGVHVIVPPEYRRLGCLLPDQFIPQLMEHLDEAYYAALLIAAELDRAAHRRRQTFQVMLAKNRRPLVCGTVRVAFVARRDLTRTPVAEMNTPPGRLRVAAPEATALDLVGYADQCGGVDNVASVLSEPAPNLDGKKLAAARLCPIAWVQRLGYSPDFMEPRTRSQVARLAKVVAPLVRAKAATGAEREPRWKLARQRVRGARPVIPKDYIRRQRG